jgi:hypothetical protein
MEGAAMARRLFTLFALTALLCGNAIAAENAAGASPKVDAMDWQGAKTVCAAWPEGKTRPQGLVWIGLPAAVKPFAMRAYVSVDGEVRPLRQIAYAHAAGDLAIHYRTLGERAYDVRLKLSGLDPAGLDGADLTGALTVSRFGLFTEIRIAGACGPSGR